MYPHDPTLSPSSTWPFSRCGNRTQGLTNGFGVMNMISENEPTTHRMALSSQRPAREGRMKFDSLCSIFAFAALLMGAEPAMARAFARVFSQPGQINDSEDLISSASASGSFSNPIIDGTLSADSSLSAGVLRLFIDASPTAQIVGNAASASALFSDTVTIVGPAASSIPIKFYFNVHAQISGVPQDNDGTARIDFAAEFDFSGNFAPNGPGFSIVRFKNPDLDVLECHGNCSFFNTPPTTAGNIDATMVYSTTVAPNLPYEVMAVMRASVMGTPARCSTLMQTTQEA